jgi:hypothetical protein
MKIITDFKIHALTESINESLDKNEIKRLKSQLKVYCEEVGSDFDEVCKLLKLQSGSLSKLNKDQIEWLNRMVGTSGTWDINEETGKIDVESNSTVYLRKNQLSLGSIPHDIQFGKFTGGLYVSDAQLESLAGFPDEIIGDLNISSNNLTSLKGCTQIIKGSFNCGSNKLENLKGGPDRVTLGYTCNNNMLESLEGAPEKIGASFNASSNSLKTLEGSPKEVGSDFSCDDNNLKTMEGAPERIDGYSISCEKNELYTLEGIPLDFAGRVRCSKNLFPEEVLKTVFVNAKRYESWIGAYLVLLTTKRFQRMSREQRDPIRKALSGDALKTKSLQLSKIWKDPIMDDPSIKRMIKRADLGQETIQDVELGSDLKDIGF